MMQQRDTIRFIGHLINRVDSIDQPKLVGEDQLVTDADGPALAPTRVVRLAPAEGDVVTISRVGAPNGTLARDHRGDFEPNWKPALLAIGPRKMRSASEGYVLAVLVALGFERGDRERSPGILAPALRNWLFPDKKVAYLPSQFGKWFNAKSLIRIDTGTGGTGSDHKAARIYLNNGVRVACLDPLVRDQDLANAEENWLRQNPGLAEADAIRKADGWLRMNAPWVLARKEQPPATDTRMAPVVERRPSTPPRASAGDADASLSITKALAEYADRVGDTWQREVSETGLYVPRVTVEETIREGLARAAWISIEADAGVGKSTLLWEEYKRSVANSSMPEQPVSLFVDAVWFARGANVVGTPLAEIGAWLGGATSVWDAIDAIAAHAERAGRSLAVFVDTLDAAVLSREERWGAWLRGAAARGHRLVTTCRPAEALRLPRERIRVELKDFTTEEARVAIGKYVGKFLADRDPAKRALAERTLRDKYLLDEAFAALCRRPVTLYLLFLAYGGNVPPEHLNRNLLYRQYWDRKVFAEASDRPHRASPASRSDLAMSLAFRLVRERIVHMPWAAMEAEATAFPDGPSAQADLLSEAVLVQEADRRRVGFFHQSLLEFAAARRIVSFAGAAGSDALRDILAPLAEPHGEPWFGVIEEVAVQADTPPNGITGLVIEALLQGHEAHRRTGHQVVGFILANLSRPGLGISEAAWQNRVLRISCLRSIHNAIPTRIADLLRILAPLSWAKGEHSERFEILDAWARVASLAPSVVFDQLDATGARDEIFSEVRHEHSAAKRAPETELIGVTRPLTPGNRGQYIRRYARVLASMLGVGGDYDRRAADELAGIYAWAVDHLTDSEQRATLVGIIAERVEISDSARDLLSRLAETPERQPDYRGAKELRQAFASALGASGPTTALQSQERSWIGGTRELRLRCFGVWRERVLAGHLAAEHVLAGYADLPSEAQNDLWTIFIEELAREAHPSLYPFLLAFYRDLRTTGRTRDRQRVEQCLRRFMGDDGHAAEIRELLSLDVSRAASRPKSEFALWCAATRTLSSEEMSVLLGAAITADALFILLESLPVELTAAHTDEVFRFLADFPTKIQARNAARFVFNHLAPRAHGATARILHWALTILRGAPDDERPRILQAIPTLAQEQGDLVVVRETIRALCADWILQKTNERANASGESIWRTAFLRLDAVDGEIGRTMYAAFRTMYRATWPSARKAALQVLSIVAHVLPDDAETELREIVNRWMQRVEVADTDAIVQAEQVLRSLASVPARDPTFWPLFVSLANLADARFGRSGWDSIQPVVRGTLFELLERGRMTSPMLQDVLAMPDPIQAGLPVWGMSVDDDKLFEFLSAQARSLHDDAERLLALWQEQRRHKARGAASMD